MDDEHQQLDEDEYEIFEQSEQNDEERETGARHNVENIANVIICDGESSIY